MLVIAINVCSWNWIGFFLVSSTIGVHISVFLTIADEIREYVDKSPSERKGLVGGKEHLYTCI